MQLHGEFDFVDAARLAGYLADLGVTHLYCSPYLQAAAGSTHGYDVVDPHRLNEELGGAPAHAEMVTALRAAGIGQLLDIVPNHMATDRTNRWWWDVLENGPASAYARFFDIDWQGPDKRAAFTVLVPVLGDHYGRALEAGEIRVDHVGGEFVVRYHDHELPVSPRTLDRLLAAAAQRAGSPELATLAEKFGELPPARTTDRTAVTARHNRKRVLVEDLQRLCRTDGDAAAALDGEVAAVNDDPDRLDELLRRQNYRLAHWRAASEDLDYRRFFNIETLVGVRVEDPDVLAETHKFIVELVGNRTVEGLRVDHVDGLRDPEGYLAALNERSGGVYTVVEKILEPGESLPGSWPVAGTSGYDFLTRVNNLFVASEQEGAMTDCYTAFTGETAAYDEVVHAAKRKIMGDELATEVARVTGLLAEVCDRSRRHRDHTRRALRDAVIEVVAHFPVYRTYVHPRRPATEADRRHVIAAVTAAREARPALDEELLRFVGELALGEHGGNVEWAFAQQLQQLTAPVMAKGVEDTAFYRYHRLVSLNEVGGDPGVFGRSPSDFHADTATMAQRWPESMLTLSTHDTKRSADVRARINVLAELPDAWRRAVQRWAETNDRHRQRGWPDRNAEYLLYQTLVGAWPLSADRAVAFIAKATKEAKVHTSWVDPAPGYDEAVESFVRAMLADPSFVDDLERFLEEQTVVARGRRNSLAQTTLLLTCPGVPDLYQGTEVWDLSLVDPDNRRRVDYHLRRRLLNSLREADAEEACADDERGGSKLWLIHRLLQHRRACPAVYTSDSYEPLTLTGRRADHAVAFWRGRLSVVVPRLGRGGWEDTAVELPAGAWSDVLTGSPVDGGRQPLEDLLSRFPVAVLARRIP